VEDIREKILLKNAINAEEVRVSISLSKKEDELLKYREYLFVRQSRHNQGTEGFRQFSAEIRENTKKLERVRDDQKKFTRLRRLARVHNSEIEE
jgi:hypothetical protein